GRDAKISAAQAGTQAGGGARQERPADGAASPVASIGQGERRAHDHGWRNGGRRARADEEQSSSVRSDEPSQVGTRRRQHGGSACRARQGGRDRKTAQ